MKPGKSLQFYDEMSDDVNATYQVKSVTYASSVRRSRGGEAEEQAATTTVSISLPLLFCLPNEKRQLLARNLKKCIQKCKFQSNCRDKTDRRQRHKCTTATRWVAPIKVSKTSWATTKFADSVSPLHQGASSQKKIDRRKLGFQLVLESVNFKPLIPLCRDCLQLRSLFFSGQIWICS